MREIKYTCPKCGGVEAEVDEFRATGGFLSKLFDVQNKRFTTVTCRNCTYTEMYKASSSQLGDIFDLFT